MNREILFRGKSANTGEWVEGFCVQFGETYSNIIIREIGKLNLYGVVPIYEHEIVISETVGQYTDLTDKNGRNIFEGDILKVIDIDEERTAPVIFRKGCFILDEKDAVVRLGVGAFRKRQLEIIGNIHDNPELVRKDEKNGEV